MPGFLKNPGVDSGLALGEGGVAQTHQTVSPQEPFYSVFTVLS